MEELEAKSKREEGRATIIVMFSRSLPFRRERLKADLQTSRPPDAHPTPDTCLSQEKTRRPRSNWPRFEDAALPVRVVRLELAGPRFVGRTLAVWALHVASPPLRQERASAHVGRETYVHQTWRAHYSGTASTNCKTASASRFCVARHLVPETPPHVPRCCWVLIAVCLLV
ncbi:uncharacterized protein K460DRAFT_90950 [Cucurbitaria berberidis CBS 394.84]|uniref:Uncharacterized protein n=1 Tax=Cucurbitaria berberidis CBS 394.84 TaxID=1168544 RepID=A0A9P4GPZ6_9PLEO|nr:uncharacterized protein K460DRAFT_90950 [Cucurbitaria berberidis CBS 394.84]KAF1849434.1 hypothetical protein K460DRAFT_90950 [Cucurbitaria berberidis CBS 394.84]